MKYILNSREMKQCDSRTIEHYGLPSMVLMERAALSVVSFLHERDLWQKKIVILCGSGNNGGDGLAIARLLYLEGGQVCGMPGGRFFQGFAGKHGAAKDLSAVWHGTV